MLYENHKGKAPSIICLQYITTLNISQYKHKNAIKFYLDLPTEESEPEVCSRFIKKRRLTSDKVI